MNMKNNLWAGVDAHTFNPGTLEPEVGRSLCIHDQPYLHSPEHSGLNKESLSQREKEKKKKKKKGLP